MIQSAFLSSFIAQLCLAVLAVAAPIADKASPTTDNENAWQFGHGGGILGIIVLILDIIVISTCDHRRDPCCLRYGHGMDILNYAC